MWARRTGWPRHLRGFDREWLVTTMRRIVAEKEEEVEEGNEVGDGEDGEDGEEVRG